MQLSQSFLELPLYLLLLTSIVGMISLFGFLVVLLLSYTIAGEDGSPEYDFLEYVRLISDVQGFFGSSSVFVVNAGHYENPYELLLMSKISKELSLKFVLSQNINFAKFHREVIYYDGKTVQSLFVIMLKSLHDLYQISATTRYYNMALHKWLIIFDKSSDKSLNEYCDNPSGNILNLVVSTKMLVKCHDSPMLKEWYSIDKVKVEARNYGNWSYDRGIVRFTRMDFHERRSDFKGYKLRVSSVKKINPRRQDDFNKNDFFGAVLIELSKKMNFTINHVSAEDSYGIWNASVKQWTGIIGKLVSKEVDIGVGELTMSKQRAPMIDYTIPLMLTFSDLYIKRPNNTIVDWSAYTKAFHKHIWIIIVVILIVAPLFLTVLYSVSKGSNIMYYYLGEEYLNVWGIYCQKSLPDATSLRIAYISIFASSLVLYAVYSAYLTSYLTVFTPVIPFDSYDDFIADGTYRLIVIRNSANHELFSSKKKSIFSKMGKLMKQDEELPLDIHSAINQVCNEKVVLFTNQLMIEKTSRYSPCELVSLTKGRLDNLGFALTKNSPYTEIINYNLKSLRAYGIIERLKRRYFKKFDIVDSSYLPVTFFGIMPIVGIFLLGIALSVGVLSIEMIIHSHRCPTFFNKFKFNGIIRRFQMFERDSLM